MSTVSILTHCNLRKHLENRCFRLPVIGHPDRHRKRSTEAGSIRDRQCARSLCSRIQRISDQVLSIRRIASEIRLDSLDEGDFCSSYRYLDCFDASVRRGLLECRKRSLVLLYCSEIA